MSSENPKSKLFELKGQIAETLNEVGAAFGAKLKELAEYLHDMEKHEAHAILSASHHAPYYAALGLQYVPPGDIVDGAGIAKSKKGKKSKVRSGRPKKSKKSAAFKLSDKKSTEYLKAIGKHEKSAKQIEKALKIKNASNAINYLKSNGLIKLSKQVGLKKFYKIA